MLQLDVGTCLEAGADPVAWIRANPGRIRSIHCKDWSPDPSIGYKTLFGEGEGGLEGHLPGGGERRRRRVLPVEQEGSRYPELETAQQMPAGISRALHGRK